MSKIVISPHGLKYQLSDAHYQKLFNSDESVPNMFLSVGCLIEDSEALPLLLSDVCCIVSLFSFSGWWKPTIVTILGFVVGTLISYIPLLFRFSLVDTVLYSYHRFIKRFFLPDLATIVISIIHGSWYVGVCCLIGRYIVNFLSKLLVDTYAMRERFNNKIVDMYLSAYRRG